MSHRIIAIPAFNDNYIWVIVHTKTQHVVVVDPGDSVPVINYLQANQLQLNTILITHHHWDHTNGIAGLVKQYPDVAVYAPKQEKISHCTHPVVDGDQVHLDSLGLHFNVYAIPGHTLGHIAYHGHDWLFSGDTLFAAGCGRLFEGTAQQMYQSLCLLASLDPDTAVYCGHEYTLANLAFAHHVEPNNPAIQVQKESVAAKIAAGQPSLPSSIAIERQCNPFLRAGEPSVKAAAETYSGHILDSPVDVFAAIRHWKDEF